MVLACGDVWHDRCAIQKVTLNHSLPEYAAGAGAPDVSCVSVPGIDLRFVLVFVIKAG